ncbi:MAG: hypothetical protein WA126_16220 [Thermodesulfovibrionales bacterium]
MRIKAHVIIVFIVGFIVAISSQFGVAIDTPHNESNNVSCQECHIGPDWPMVLYWFPIFTPHTIDDTPFNMLCLSCHVASSGPYFGTAPRVKTHSSVSISNKYGEWTRECRTCHNPHFQLQKNYKSTDAGNLYLAQGTITSCVYNGVDGTSTLNYSSITYKTGWDATKLTKKTSDYRRTVLFPNVDNLNYDYPITAVDSGAITVKGNACTNLSLPNTFAVMYGQYIKNSIDIKADPSVSPPPESIYKAVKFFDQTGTNSFADGDTTYNGICEVCHTQTKHFRNDGGGSDPNHVNHNGVAVAGTNCITCHPHTEGFKPNCKACHGHDAGYEYETGNFNQGEGTFKSHSTHTENDSDDLKGPNIGCSGCHDTNNYPYFKTGTDSNGDGKYDLSETDVCNTCHSPNGTYNGVSDPVIGAKNNWNLGVYSGNFLRSGKEKWCAGCHDENPANSKADGSGVAAPNVIGDEDAATQYGTGYGFYKTGHGLATGSYPASGGPAANAKCTDCHNTTYAHIDHDSRTYVAARNNYQAGYRLNSVNGAPPMDIPRNDVGMPKSDFALCGQCHDLDLFLDQTNLTTNLRSVKTSGTSTGLSETILTDTTKAWGGLAGSALIPDIEKPWNVYLIISNTATTITVNGSMLSDGAQPGNNYRVEVNSHWTHLQSTDGGSWNPFGNCGKWDSDYDNALVCPPPWTGSIFDSTVSCPTCHNVHGSTLPRMARDGNLVSGRSLGFYYVPPYSYPNSTKLPDSDGGRWSQSVCGPCHSSSGTYSRVAKGTVTFSSDADQYFSVADPPTTISTITITDNPQTASITAANNIRIRIPGNFNMTWDTTDMTATFGGSAATKVNSTVSFPDNKTLLIDVTSDFAAGDTLTVEGLSFTNFSAVSGQDNLELYIDGGHTLCTENAKTILIGTKAIISSTADQTFAIGDWSTAISPITIKAITDDADIKSGNDIRIKIPSAFPMEWDTSDISAIISGSAAAKVSTTVSYPDTKTLLLTVITDFSEGDEITVSGLKFRNFYVSAAADNLELYVDGALDATADALDDKTIIIEDKHWMTPIAIVRGYCSNELGCYDYLIDNDLTTGNLARGINGILDLGREYLVTHIRVYANTNNNWYFKVGNTLSDCLSDGIDVTGKWKVGYVGPGWYEKAVTQASGRYMRIQYADAGNAPDNGIMEVEFLGIPLDNYVKMSSAAGQDFEVGQAAASISPITITESSTSPTITASNDIRIVIPYSLYMSWDTSDTVATIGGTASGKVSSTVSYPDDKTLLIDVTSNFAAGDTLTVEGLSFKNFLGQSYTANLGLSVDGGMSLAATDAKSIQIWDWISPVDVAEESPKSIIDTVNLTNTTLTLANQPDYPTFIAVKIVDTIAPKINSGTVTITGTTADGPGQIEVIDCSAGAGYHVGNKIFETIDSIVTADFAPLNGGGDETIAVSAPDCCNLNNSRYLVDNNTATGNTGVAGSYVVFDLGDTYTVTGIRMFTTVQYGWDIYVSDNLDGCTGTMGTQVKFSWTSPGDSAWHATAINPTVSGRYIRINALGVGGGLANMTIREFDFQGYKNSENRNLTISSFADQTFEKDQSATPIQPINIKYYPTNGTITTVNDIRIKIPASFNMTWDTTDTTATFGGSAASKVSSIVSYPDNKTLLINVTENFSAGDTLSISGLSFKNFSNQSFKNHLQLSIDGGSTVAATDSKYIWVIHWQSPIIYAACTDLNGAANVIDRNTATGNLWGGGIIVFDMGSSKKVRFIRVWENIDRQWGLRIGDGLTSCGTDWPAIKTGWHPAVGQWTEIPATPMTGRYMRFNLETGGPQADVLREFQYQAW